MLTGSPATKEWKLKPAGLSNVTSVRLNPYIIEQSDCTFGCVGHLCDAADDCSPNLLCKNSICQVNPDSQPGKVGDRCNSKAVCQSHLRCVEGECAACVARTTIQPENKKRKRTIPGDSGMQQEEEEYRRRYAVKPNDPKGTCYTDSLPHLFETIRLSPSSPSPQPPPICLPPSHHPNPCTTPTHCSASQYCSWGLCTPCSATDACLGSPCRSNNACKTGFCNDYGRCDYVAARKKKATGPGGARGKVHGRVAGVPRGFERGPARVRSESMRVVIPEEEEGPAATATAAA